MTAESVDVTLTFDLSPNQSATELSRLSRDVTDSKSASESDRIRHFSGNPKSVRYLNSDRNGFKIFVSVQLYNYFRK